MFCKKCGSSLSDGALFCKKCGNRIVKKSPAEEIKSEPQYNAVSALVCEKCGNGLKEGALFCKKCGSRVAEKLPAAVESKPQTPPAPQYTAPQYTAPQYTTQQYTAPMYGTPVPAAPKKQSKWQKAPRKDAAIVSMVLWGGLLVFMVIWFSSLSRSPDEPDVSSGSSYSQSVGNTGGNTGGNTVGNTGGNAGGNTGGNVGGNTGGYTEPEPVKQQTFTSPKTGTTFTIPDEGYAEIVSNGGSKKTVGAEYTTHTPSEYFPTDTYFTVYVDDTAVSDLNFALSSGSGGWKRGKKLGRSELCLETRKPSNYVSIGCTVAYLTTTLDRLVSSSLPKYYADAEFEVLDADSSGKAVKFWFYLEYKVSGSGKYYTIEGVGNTVLGAEPGGGGSSGGSGGSSGGGGLTPSGKTKCGVCNGGGLVNCGSCNDGFNMCPNCNGTGTYYNYAQGRIVNCNRTGCSAGKIQCTKCRGTGKKECGSCGGDGYR